MIDTLPEQKLLPHSVEAERAVLGGLLLEPEGLADVQGWLDFGDFYVERHRLIYQTMLGLAAEGTPIDYLSVQALLEQRGQFEQVGGLAYLTGLDLDLPDISRMQFYCEIIRDRALRRRLIRKAGETIRAMLDGAGETVANVAGRLIGELDKIVRRQTGDGYRPISAILPEYMDLVEEPRVIRGLTTGIPHIDGKLKAFERGRLLKVGGRAGVGKSAMMVQMAYREVLAGERVGIVSLEMREKSLVNRLIAHGAGVPATRLWQGHLTQAEWTRVILVSRFLANHDGIDVDDWPTQRFEEIRAKARRLVREKHIRTLFIDYGGLVVRPGTRREHIEVQEMSDDLGRLAAELDIIIVELCQVNRGPAKEDRPPRVSDLREAGEQAAWYVLILHRWLQELSTEDEGKPAVYGPRGMVIVGKNRDGDETGCSTYYDGPRLQWWAKEAWEACGGQRGAYLPVQHQQELLTDEP